MSSFEKDSVVYPEVSHVIGNPLDMLQLLPLLVRVCCFNGLFHPELNLHSSLWSLLIGMAFLESTLNSLVIDSQGLYSLGRVSIKRLPVSAISVSIYFPASERQKLRLLVREEHCIRYLLGPPHRLLVAASAFFLTSWGFCNRC